MQLKHEIKKESHRRPRTRNRRIALPPDYAAITLATYQHGPKSSSITFLQRIRRRDSRGTRLMHTIAKFIAVPSSLILLFVALTAQGTKPTPTTAQSVRRHFASVNRKVLTMVKDFPEDKYDFRFKPEMRSFNELIVPISSGNGYAAKAGGGEKE